MILVTGEALVDLVEGPEMRFEAKLGGSCYNLARALARLDAPTAFVCPFSADPFGRRLAATLQADGVQLLAPTDRPEPTPIALVALGDDGQPTYAFHRQGTADRTLDGAAIADRLPVDLAMAHFGSLSLVDPNDFRQHLKIAQAAHAAGALIGVDPNMRPAATPDPAAHRAQLAQLFEIADYIRLSDEDLAALEPEMAAVEPIEAVFELFASRWRPALAVLTLGPRGATARAFGGAVATRAARPPKNFADAIGAGDVFNAALISHLFSTDSLSSEALSSMSPDALAQALDIAALAAGVCCGEKGCAPPTSAVLAAAREAAGNVL